MSSGLTVQITGITARTACLAELLLEKGDGVHGITQHASLVNTQLTCVLWDIEAEGVYNLGARPRLALSFGAPNYTAYATSDGVPVGKLSSTFYWV